MTIDMNVTQLVAAIERSKLKDDGTDSGVGLSVNRTVENGVSQWDVFLGQSHQMTILDSETDYHDMPSADVAALVIKWWDAEWDD